MSPYDRNGTANDLLERDEERERRRQQEKTDSETQENGSEAEPGESPPSRSGSFADHLKEREEEAKGGVDNEGAAPAKSDPEAGLYHPENKKKKENAKGSTSKWRRRGLLAAGGGGGLALISVLVFFFLFLSSLKVVHFSQVLISSGYARLNGIVQERTTQNVFDSSVVEGSGSADINNRTLLDRMKFRNVELELAKMGRAGDFALLNDKEGSTTGFRVKDTTIDYNEISKDLYGKGFSDASFTERLGVRKAFVDRAQSAISENLATESRVIRSRATSIVADNVGFGWSRWRQSFREKYGAEPDRVKLDVEDRAAQAAETNAEGGATTGVSEIDDIVKDAKNPEKLKKILEKSGGDIDSSVLRESLAADAANAAKIGNVASSVSTAVLVLSIDCMAYETFSHYDEVASGNEKQASLVGLNLASANSQTKAGATTGELQGSAARQLDGAELAPDYQSQFGGQGDPNVNIPKLKTNENIETLKTLTSPSNLFSGGATGIAKTLGFNPFGLIDSVDNTICKTVLSPTGLITIAAGDILVQAVVDFFSAGGGTIAEQAGGKAAAFFFIKALARATWATAGELVSVKTIATVGLFTLYGYGLQFVAQALAGTAISGGTHGAAYYETAYAGTRAVQNRVIRSVSFGKPLSDTEAATVDVNYNARAKDKWLKKGMVDRYFAVSNPYSITGSIFAYVPSKLNNWGIKIGSLFANLGDVMNGTVLKLALAPAFTSVNQHAFARPPVDDNKFGLTPWGFSPDELEKMANDPTYGIAENEKYISQEEIKNFDDTIGQDCYNPAITQYEVGKKDNCTAAKLSEPQVLRYRIYKFDNSVANMSTGNEGV